MASSDDLLPGRVTRRHPKYRFRSLGVVCHGSRHSGSTDMAQGKFRLVFSFQWSGGLRSRRASRERDPRHHDHTDHHRHFQRHTFDRAAAPNRRHVGFGRNQVGSDVDHPAKCPLITSVSREALLTVPRAQREGSAALGATKWETILSVILPAGRSGIVGAAILALGRAIGETMAVTMVGGNSFDLIHSLFDPVHSMASQIASEFTEATYNLYVSSLIYVGLVLFGITMIISLCAQFLIWRLSKGRVAVFE